jgi:hypothetical protein
LLGILTASFELGRELVLESVVQLADPLLCHLLGRLGVRARVLGGGLLSRRYGLRRLLAGG